MAAPVDLIVPTLREIRADSERRHAEVLERFDRVEHRIKAVEEAQRTFKHALIGDTLLGRILTGESEERVEDLQQRVRALEGQS
jgi:hypothetical protein